MKQDRRKIQQIQPGLNDLAMADCDIDSGEAPGLRVIVTVFLVFFEQALSSIVIHSMVSITPKSRVKRSRPAEPHS